MIRTNLLLAGDDGYNLTKSLRFRSSASAYLNRTPSTAGNQQKWTWSGWVKIGKTENQTLFAARTASSGTYTIINIDTANNVLRFVDNTTSSPTCETSAYYRDYAGWYHFVVAVDTTQATASNRIKIYTNGVLQTLSVTNYPSQNANLNINSTATHLIGQQASGAYFDGYMAEVNFIDGQQLTPSSFGSTNALTGVWQPAKYTGTYGTNGFYLPFTNTTSTSTLGTDFSGNSNTWTVNNISLTTGSTYDSMNDVPTLTSATTGNYCVVNPLMFRLSNTPGATITNGNLTSTHTPTAYGSYVWGTVGVSSGKWYWEITATTVAGSDGFGIDTGGMQNSSTAGAIWYLQNGSKTVFGSSSSYGATWTSGDVIGVALDMNAGTLTYYKNNTSQGVAATGLTGTFLPFGLGEASAVFNWNFGQQPFTYTPPTGFVALNTFNLPTSTIVKGNTVMDATTYAGTSATQSVTNTAGFKPDFIWVKNRTGANDNILFDSNRGSNGSYYYELISNGTTQENYYTAGNYGMVSAINSNGFTLASSNSNWNLSNATGNNYVGWQWQAGQGTNTTNTSGSITSTVSVNATAGFSVVTYTGTGTGGATIGHGLGVAPSMIIVKRRDAGASGWSVYFTTLPAGYVLSLQSTAAQANSSGRFTTTLPTSSVFSVGTDSDLNASAGTYVAYCWSEIAGFSKFGSYTGNGSTDGPFVYTGFRPKFVMVKCSTAVEGWYMWDTSRDTYNSTKLILQAQASTAELGTSVDTYAIDVLSNGFKLRQANVGNQSSQTMIYMAFAENPLKFSLAR